MKAMAAGSCSSNAMDLRSLIRRGRLLAGCMTLLAGPAAVAATPAAANSPLEALVRNATQLLHPAGGPDVGPPPPPARKPPAPVAAATSADPVGSAPRGTMIMVHAGGWAGHDRHAQELLSQRPGQLLLERGWRIVSIDYDEGVDGLQDVLDAAGAELARDGDAPLCIYGESSGAHLALVAASRLRAIDCVIGLGTPTDLALYESEGSVAADFRIRLVASQMSRFFGTTTAELAAWDPVALAPSIDADVMLIREADDWVVPQSHMARFQAARPTTQTVVLEPGDQADPSTSFVHGTVSEVGRGRYVSAIASFADRATAAHQAERAAARTGCVQATRSVARAGVGAVQSALRCLARNDGASLRAGGGSWQRTSVQIHGEVNAARIWAHLRETKRGRRALVAAAERRARVTVHTGDRSRVMLRATR